MELNRPKAKNNYVSKGKLLPLKTEKKIIGVFNGEFVMVRDLDSMDYLYKYGNFGKGNLSKGEPNYHISKDDIPKIMFRHQFDNQIKWNPVPSYSYSQKYFGSVRHKFDLSLQSIKTFLQSSFSDKEEKSWKENQKKESDILKNKTELSLLEFKTGESDYKDEEFTNFVNNILHLRQIKKLNNFNLRLKNVIILNTSFNPHEADLSSANKKTELECLPYAPEENLNLNLEESFFLKSVLESLNIVDLNFSEIKIPDLWEKFNEVDKNFTERYITYHYYRSKGWIIKSGLKFGGDYLLYKNGPAYYHATYLVKVLDKRKKITWREFIAINRLVETFNKDLLLSNVMSTIQVKSDQKSFPHVLTNHLVQEVLVKRWIPTKERFSK